MAYNRTAIATKTTALALLDMAEQHGEAQLLLPSERDCYKLRHRLYKIRTQLRKQSAALQGIEASPYDGYEFEYAFSEEHQAWLFTIGFNLPMEIVILIPDWVKPEDLPAFDVPEHDHEAVPSLEFNAPQLPEDEIPF